MAANTPIPNDPSDDGPTDLHETLESGIDKTDAGPVQDAVPTDVASAMTLEFADLVEPTASSQEIEATMPSVPGGGTVRVGVGNRSQDNLPAENRPEDGGTILSSRQIDRTISSADMTGRDAAVWGNLTKQSLPAAVTAVGTLAEDSRASVSREPPQSIVDTRLNLRTRQLLPEDSPPETLVEADYRLVRLLGKGGMGNVYVARQGSLDRLVALKVIKPLDGDKRQQLMLRGLLEKTERQRRSQFISEAVVTGDLEHPNIVPIHDIAVSEDNTLFYSMKRVSGTPWSKVIGEKSRDENLEILLKVCDAIGFAHTRGIVHRDIKPENIMLGDFGIVMVMDWGLALAKPGFEKIDSIYPATGLGGSPAYMAPEMATGPLDSIAPAADIYLLGATLFQIITGNAPHVAPNITECLRAVAANKIREVQPQHEGELLDIAMKAMATRPMDRYPDVISFQNAIRQYRSHSESIALATKAIESLALGNQSQSYNSFARAIFGFEEAIALWNGNQRAKTGLQDAKVAYATAAYHNGDFDLGLSLLDADDVDHHELIEKITTAMSERASRQSRLKTLRVGVAALLSFILVGGAVSIYTINDRARAAASAQQLAEANAQQATVNLQLARTNEREALQNLELATRNFQAAEKARTEALAEKMRAEKSEQDAKDQALIAVQARSKAEQAEQEAIAQRALAVQNAIEASRQEMEARKQQQEAERQRERSDYESYVSRINLVKARIDQNEFEDARRVLDQLRTERGDAQLGWEWRWLSRQTRRASATLSTGASPIDLAVSASGESVVVVLDDGTIRQAIGSPTVPLRWSESEPLVPRGFATSVALADDGMIMAVANSVGEIELWDMAARQRVNIWQGHQGPVRALTFTTTGWLVSGSDDRTAKLWDVRFGVDDVVSPQAVCWNLGPVVDVAVAGVDEGFRLVVAIAESNNGYVGLWDLLPSENESRWRANARGSFRQHGKPVTAVDISDDGHLVVSGDSGGGTFVWDPATIEPIDYQLALAGAIEKNADAFATDRSPTPTSPSTTQPTGDQSVAGRVRPLRRVVGATSDPLASHRGAIRSVKIAPDGRSVMTTSDDYTIGIWDAVSSQLVDELRGHGGWVIDATFIPADPKRVISIANDRTLRTWKRAGGDPQLVGSGAESSSLEATDFGLERRRLHDGAITTVRFDPTGSLLMTTSRDQTSKVVGFDRDSQSFLEESVLWDQAVATLQEGSSFAAMSFVIDPARQRLFVGSADATVGVWEWQNTTEIGRIELTGLNESLAITPDGRYLLTGSSDPQVSCILWEIQPGNEWGIRKLQEFRGHAQATTCFAISNDGRSVFTGDRGGIGILWDAQTGKPVGPRIEQLRGYRLNDVAFSPDGSQLLIAADDYQVSTISLASRSLVSRLSHDGPVLSMQRSPDQRLVVTITEQPSRDGVKTKATLWDLATGAGQEICQAVLAETSRSDRPTSPQGKPVMIAGRIVSARFSHIGSTIAVGILDAKQASMIRLLEVSPSIEVSTRDGFRLPTVVGALSTAVPLPGGQLLTLSGDSAFWWDGATQQQVRSFRTNGPLAQASFSSDGQYAVTTSQGVKIWDVRASRALLKLELPHAGPVHAAEFSPLPGASMFATAGNDGVVKLWNWDAAAGRATEIRQWPLDGPPVAVRRLRFSASGDRLAAVGDRGLVRLLSIAGDGEIRLDGVNPETQQATPEDLLAVAWSRDGRYLATGGTDSIGRIWEVTMPDPTGFHAVMAGTLIGHADRIEDILFLEDGSQEWRVLTASRDKSARVWDPRLGRSESMGREIMVLRGHLSGVTSIDICPSHRAVVTGGADGQMILWPADELDESLTPPQRGA